MSLFSIISSEPCESIVHSKVPIFPGLLIFCTKAPRNKTWKPFYQESKETHPTLFKKIWSIDFPGILHMMYFEIRALFVPYGFIWFLDSWKFVRRHLRIKPESPKNRDPKKQIHYPLKKFDRSMISSFRHHFFWTPRIDRPLQGSYTSWNL